MNRPNLLRTSFSLVFFPVILICAFLQPVDLGKLVHPAGKSLLQFLELAKNNSELAKNNSELAKNNSELEKNNSELVKNNSELVENISIVAIKNYDSPGATVAVATIFISKNSLYKGLGFWNIVSNFQNYSKINGYDLHVQLEIPKFNKLPTCYPICWMVETRRYKIQVIMNLLDMGYDWVFWTDADTLFTNLTKQLPIPLDANETEIIFCGDHKMVNSGHILLHNSPWTRKFLQAWMEMKKARHKYILQDNSGLVVLLALGIEDALTKNVSELARIEHSEEQTCYRITTQEEATRAMEQKMHKSFRDKVKILPQNIMNAYPPTWKAGLLLVHLAGQEYTNGDWVRKMGLL